MRAIGQITRKELIALFASPIAYFALTAVALAMSLFFLDNLKAFNTQIMLIQSRSAFDQITAGIIPFDLNLFDQVLVPTVIQTAMVLLALVPLITMGVFCEERTRRTDELLLTLPVSETQLVAGKFLATFLFLVAVVGVTALFPALTTAHTHIDGRPILTSFLGILAFCFGLASIGLLCSALATNQLVAALSTYAICSALFDFGWLTQFTGDTMDRVLQFLSLATHLEGFPRGVVSLSDLVYFVSLCLLGFLLCRVSLAIQRIT